MVAAQNTAWINPYDYPDSWNHVILAGQISPGLVTECAGSNPRKFDKRDGNAQSGATIVYNGDGLAEFPIKIQLGWEDDGTRFENRQQQFADWDDFKKILVSPTTKNPNAIQIFYPNLYLLPVPITAIQIQDVAGPKEVKPGIWEWEIKCIQYRKANVASSKASAAALRPGQVTVQTAQQAEIAALSAQIAARGAKPKP